jgi:hypothetical protein
MLIISKIRGDIRKSRCTTGVNGNDTGGKFAIGVNDAGGKLPPVSTTPGANLSPVSTTMGTISGCRHLKVNLKAKIYIYVNSTT